MQAVAGLARLAVAYPIRQYNEKFRHIERLIFSKQFTRKFRTNKLRAAAGCSMHDQNGISRFAFRILFRFPQCSVMKTQLG